MLLEYFVDTKDIKWYSSVFRVVQEGPRSHSRKIADELNLEGEDRYLFLSSVDQVDLAKNCLAVVGAMALATVPYICVKALTR